MNSKLAKLITDLFPDYMERRNLGQCKFCTKVIKLEDFVDEKSLKEFTISRLCQDCQDRIFK